MLIIAEIKKKLGALFSLTSMACRHLHSLKDPGHFWQFNNVQNAAFSLSQGCKRYFYHICSTAIPLVNYVAVEQI